MQKQEKSPGPLKVKTLVRERDGFRCVDCAMTDEEHRNYFKTGLQVHRLTPKSQYIVDGCVTVCYYCHRARHGAKTATLVTKKVSGFVLSARLNQEDRRRIRELMVAIEKETGRKCTAVNAIRVALREALKRRLSKNR